MTVRDFLEVVHPEVARLVVVLLEVVHLEVVRLEVVRLEVVHLAADLPAARLVAAYSALELLRPEVMEGCNRLKPKESHRFALLRQLY